MRLPVGTKVRAAAIGVKAVFYGEIVGYTNDGSYVVRDERDGSEWVRTRRELSAQPGGSR